MPRRTAAGNKKSRRGTSDRSRAGGPGRLRIVAGNWRSRVLEVADIEGLRPTPERVRETLFNWLGPGIVGRRCLDLYAGTGALGLEALSRGAKQVVFVERSKRAADVLVSNIEKLDAAGATLIVADAADFLGRFTEKPFDVVFLDPPFADDGIQKLCRLLADKGIIAAGGRVYFEQDRDQDEPSLPAGWRIVKQKSAGNVRYGLIETKQQQ